MAEIPAAAIRAAVVESLESSTGDAAFRNRAAGSLQSYPYILHPEATLRASALALGSFQASGGQGPCGVIVAAAMEILTTAAHLLDRLADDEEQATPSDLQVGTALILIVASVLERVRATHQNGAGPIDWTPVYRGVVTSCSGQQRDIDLQAIDCVDLEDAKTMTEAKTGGYGEALILAGAIAAGACAELQSDLGLVGFLLGTSTQLIDDASDASTKAPGTSDIALRKKTVPIAYFLSCRDDNPEWDRLRDRFLAGGISQQTAHSIRGAIEDCGAVQLTLTLANWYRMKAEAMLDKLEARRCETGLLRQFAAGLGAPQMVDRVGQPPLYAAPRPA